MTRRPSSRLVLFSTFVGSFGLLLACASAPVVVEPSFEDKIARLMKLENERSLGDGEIDARLADLDGRVRARAALALGRIGNASGMAKLVRLLDDPSPYVRTSAVFAIGLLDASLSDTARSRLEEALSDEAPSVRGRAAETLARKVGGAVAEPIATATAAHLPTGQEPYDWTEPITRSELRFPHFDTRLGILSVAKLSDLRWGFSLIATQGQTPRFLWWPAAWAASRLEGDELAPILLFYAGSPDPVLRMYGARGLGSTSEAQAKDQLRLLAFDPNEKVRIEAIRSAARLGLDEITPDLLRHLGTDTIHVQAEVLKALTRLRHPDATELVIDLIGSERAWIRGLALGALAHQSEDTFFLLLSGIGSDPDWHARAALADILGRLGSERARARLAALSEDPDARVRARVLESLARYPNANATGLFIERLRAEDPFERAAAAEALAALSASDGVAPLEQAFLVERNVSAKTTMLSAMWSLAPDKAVELATDAEDDSSYLLRRRAASITGADVRPRPSEHGVEHYLELAAVPYTPQAFVETARGRIEIELFIADAPLTVENFMSLARGGFYDGLTFHEVVPNGFVRAGDPRGDGHGGSERDVRSEINERPFVRGTVALADFERDAASSQFVITHLPAPELDGRLTVFGQVSSGMDVVDRLEPGDVIDRITIWDGVTDPYSQARPSLPRP